MDLYFLYLSLLIFNQGQYILSYPFPLSYSPLPTNVLAHCTEAYIKEGCLRAIVWLVALIFMHKGCIQSNNCGALLAWHRGSSYWEMKVGIDGKLVK